MAVARSADRASGSADAGPSAAPSPPCRLPPGDRCPHPGSTSPSRLFRPGAQESVLSFWLFLAPRDVGETPLRRHLCVKCILVAIQFHATGKSFPVNADLVAFSVELSLVLLLWMMSRFPVGCVCERLQRAYAQEWDAWVVGCSVNPQRAAPDGSVRGPYGFPALGAPHPTGTRLPGSRGRGHILLWFASLSTAIVYLPDDV